MYSEHLSTFAGQPVVDFDNASAWKGTGLAYRVRENYEDDVSIAERLDALTSHPQSSELRSLVVGAWSGACEGNDATEIVGKLIDNAPRLSSLRAIFLGDITYEESELSWINQTDIGPLLRSYPKLEQLTIRGSNGLTISRVQHSALREFAIESGGLPRSVIRELFSCELPALERLELLLGEENYGFDGSVEDLQPLLAGQVFPKLRFLGLMNATIANDIAAFVVNAPIIARIETLDLSMGNLDDEGVRSLFGLAGHGNLKRVDISHHYASKALVAELAAALQCEVIADDPQSPEDDWRPILHAE